MADLIRGNLLSKRTNRKANQSNDSAERTKRSNLTGLISDCIQHAKFGDSSYPPLAVTSNFKDPHVPRLASSKISTSDNGAAPCLNLIHFACEIPLAKQTEIVAFANVANKAMRALSVISCGQSGSARPL
jgi:hypothetical protein